MMRTYFEPAAILFLGGFVLSGCTPGMTTADIAALPTAPAGGQFTVKQGDSVVIYGARGRICGVAPDFGVVLDNSFRRYGSQKPKQGTLSDGGIAKRRSGSCNGEIPVRAVVYTAGDKAGSDEVIFSGSDRATITITE